MMFLVYGSQPARNQQKFKSINQKTSTLGRLWLNNPLENGKPKVDANNPDKGKRNQPIVGLVILKDFKFDGDNEGVDGDIYDPEGGKTYSCYLTLEDKNSLKVRGYIGMSLFG